MGAGHELAEAAALLLPVSDLLSTRLAFDLLAYGVLNEALQLDEANGQLFSRYPVVPSSQLLTKPLDLWQLDPLTNDGRDRRVNEKLGF